MLENELPKTYDQKQEADLYKLWEISGYFNPDNLNGEPFCIVMPPPNVTGTLHVGHALGTTLQDIMIRYNRMRSKKTLWLPGTDHAAIATQSKVEAIIYKEEGKTRHDLGREEFLKRVEQFASDSHDTIVKQLKGLGASADWSREAYTLDEKRTLAVRTAFKQMYDDGIIYRGKRIVNWDPKLQTTVSDDEIEWVEGSSNLYYLKYGPFTIATARPETKFGDKYVVVHPDDKRYAKFKHGEKIELEWINGPVTATVIKDPIIDMEFGTGAMTITPWHDATDYEIALRHKLDFEQIIDEKGKLLPIAGEEFQGLHINKARPLIIEKLSHKGLVEKIDTGYKHKIATNSRGGGVIEPQIKEQWFVDVNKKFRIKNSNLKNIKTGQEVSLKELMRYAVESGEVKIIPDHFSKIYFHWIDNLRDWCISRQIWYGHRIPVWYRNSKIHVGLSAPQEDGWEQDPDTLDTWFSSGLWTFSALGWPEETEDLKTFHPTSVLETGWDILFFWVARMILMSTYLRGEVPFRTVFLHGMVRDKNREKMSKSKGNIIEPLQIAEKYGVDALRMALVVGVLPGVDSAMSEDKIRGYRNFANKIWNASRFVLMNIKDFNPTDVAINDEDAKLIREMENMAAEVTDMMDKHDFAHAAETLYHYFWHTFADKILEESKAKLADPAKQISVQAMLIIILKACLKLLHPFMPFVTEAIWQLIHKELLMVQPWPQGRKMEKPKEKPEQKRAS